MADLDEVLSEMREHREETRSAFASLGTKVDAHADACQERNRAAHARISEVKDDLEADVRELRAQGKRPALVSGAGASAGVVGLYELFKRLLGLDP